MKLIVLALLISQAAAAFQLCAKESDFKKDLVYEVNCNLTKAKCSGTGFAWKNSSTRICQLQIADAETVCTNAGGTVGFADGTQKGASKCAAGIAYIFKGQTSAMTVATCGANSKLDNKTKNSMYTAFFKGNGCCGAGMDICTKLIPPFQSCQTASDFLPNKVTKSANGKTETCAQANGHVGPSLAFAEPASTTSCSKSVTNMGGLQNVTAVAYHVANTLGCCKGGMSSCSPKKATQETTASTKVEGSITVVAAGVTKAQVEAASKTALAEHFAVAATRLTTTATETRRLGVDGNDRRLKGTWTIAYSFLALPAEVTSINTKVATATSAPDAFKKALTTKFIASLRKAGVTDTVADAIVVSSATSVATTTDATTGTSGAAQTSLAFLLICAFTAVF